jgi:zeaxanthin glucosyltransferase
MSRFLFVTLPLAGHVNPPAAVARVLTEGGHEVAWCGSQARLRPWLGPDATIYPTGMRLFRGQADTGMTAVKSLWEGFIVPFTRFTLPAVEEAVAGYRPDVVVTDQHALAGSLVARRQGLPWATLCTSSFELTAPFRQLPNVEAWIRGQIAAATGSEQPGPGQPDPGQAGGDDPLFSPYLVIVFSTAKLLGDRIFPAHFALVGPALAARPPAQGGADAGFDLDPARRHVLVSVGTMADDVAMDFYGRAIGALAPLGDRVQAIVLAPPQALPALPGHVTARERVPMLELLPQLDAVVCHGGMNTVCETLSHGVPLVVAPLTRDQPVNAGNVVRAGAGLRVNFHRATPEQLRAALLTVLEDPGYRDAAGRIRDSFRSAGGAAQAAARLVSLAGRSVTAGTETTAVMSNWSP